MSDSLSFVDAAWLHMDEPTNPMTVTALLWFADPPEWDAFLARVGESLVGRYPRFRQRLADPAARVATWEDEPGFTLTSRVRRVQLADPGDEAALQHLLSDRASEPIDLRSPPWTLDLVDGYRPDGSPAGAAIFRAHHCMADGIALARLLLDLADGPASGPHARRPPTAAAELDLLHERAAAAAALRKLVLTPPDSPSRLKGPLGTRKLVTWTRAVPLDHVKARGREVGGTVNDVMTAAVAGALRQYLLAHAEAALDLRAFVPVDLRGGEPPDPDLGNRFGLVYLPLPVAEPDPVERVRAVQREMAKIKRTPEAAVAFGVLSALGALPTAAESLLVDIFGAKGTLVLTNVRGPDEPVTIAGHPLAGVMFWVPQSGHLGLGVSILSYGGFVRVGVAADAGLVPDPGLLASRIEAELLLPWSRAPVADHHPHAA